MPTESQITKQGAENLLRRANALQDKATEVAKLNPLMAAGQIKALVSEACANMRTAAVIQCRLIEEIEQLKRDLAGVLPKGGN